MPESITPQAPSPRTCRAGPRPGPDLPIAAGGSAASGATATRREPLVVIQMSGSQPLLIEQSRVPQAEVAGYDVLDIPATTDPAKLEQGYNDPHYAGSPTQLPEVRVALGYEDAVASAPTPSRTDVEGVNVPITSAVYGSPTRMEEGVTGVNTQVSSPDAAIRILAGAPDGAYTDADGNPVPASYWQDLIAQADAGTFDLTTMQPTGERPVTPEQMTPAEQAAKLGQPIYASHPAVPDDQQPASVGRRANNAGRPDRRGRDAAQ